MNGDCVAGLGAFYKERAGLRIQVRELAHPRHKVVRAADPAGEAILGPQLQDRARQDPGYRRDAAEGPGELAGRGPERQNLRIAHEPSPYLRYSNYRMVMGAISNLSRVLLTRGSAAHG